MIAPVYAFLNSNKLRNMINPSNIFLVVIFSIFVSLDVSKQLIPKFTEGSSGRLEYNVASMVLMSEVFKLI